MAALDPTLRYPHPLPSPAPPLHPPPSPAPPIPHPPTLYPADKDAGYDYVCIDDGWSTARDPVTHQLVADPEKFPSGMKKLGQVRWPRAGRVRVLVS